MASKAAKLHIAEDILFRYRGAMAAMHHRAQQYNQLKMKNEKDAIGHLYHGLDFPRKAKRAILKLAEKNPDIDIAECLELDRRATYDEIMTDIDNTISQSNAIIAKIESGELISHDAVATDVINNAEDIFGRTKIDDELTEEEKQQYILKVDPDKEVDVLIAVAEEKFNRK